MARRVLTILERVLLGSGLVLLAICVIALLDRAIASRRALRKFDAAVAANPAGGLHKMVELPAEGDVDFSLWDEKRIREYHESLRSSNDTLLGVLRIEKLKIRVPVFEGTDEWALNRGVGWIAGTTRLDEAGNVGIAGHRDGFFRGLKDISLADTIELTTLRGTMLYTVDQLEVVKPENVEVLRPRNVPSLTLVTCYPFYFVGDAPRRFIVHAAQTRQAAVGGIKPVP
jgi:sortase A